MARRRSQEHFLRRYFGVTDFGQIIALLAFSFVFLAAAYAAANPLFEATDEIRHFRYVRYLQENRALPPLTAEASKQYQAHHPPLYYTLVALSSAAIPSTLTAAHEPPINPYWGFRYFEVSTDNKAQYLHTAAENFPGTNGYQTVWIGRVWSIAFGFGAVVFTWLLTRELFPNTPTLALGAAAFLAFNPMFLHGSASLNNDVPAAFFGAGLLYSLARLHHRGLTSPNAALVAAMYGLGTLTKANILPLIAPVAAVFAVMLWPHRTDRARYPNLLRALLPAAAIILLTTGAWTLYSFLQTGSPFGVTEYTDAWVGEATSSRLIGEAIANLPYTYTTLWARFNYGQIPVADWVYHGFTVTTLLGLVLAALYPVLQPRFPDLYLDPDPPTAPLWPHLLALIVSVAAWAWLMISVPATANARLIFPVYPVLGLLVALGLSRFRAQQLTILMPATLLLLATIAFGGYLQPAYAYPGFESAPRADDQPPTPLSVRVADLAELQSVRLTAPDPLLPGEVVEVSLTWRPLRRTDRPLSVFLHLIDSDGVLAAQRDTWPGLGNAPTTVWRTLQPFTDTYRIFIPETAYTPTDLTLTVGLWDPATGQRQPLTDDDQPIGDALTLGQFALSPTPGDAPNALNVNFANVLDLRGYQLTTRQLTPGAALELTTYWWAAARMTETYSLFAHLIGPDGEIWGRQDSVLLPLTPDWPAQELRLEIRTLTLSPDAPPGQYRLDIGLWRGADVQARLPMLHPDGREMGDTLTLTHLIVTPAP